MADVVRKFFRPELINRIDGIAPFYPLESDDLVSIAQRMVDDIRGRDGVNDPEPWGNGVKHVVGASASGAFGPVNNLSSYAQLALALPDTPPDSATARGTEILERNKKSAKQNRRQFANFGIVCYCVFLSVFQGHICGLRQALRNLLQTKID